MDLITSFAEINNSDRLLQDLRDAIVQKAITQPADSLFTIVPGIKGGQQVVALKDYEYITKQQAGCDPTFTDFNIAGFAQKWNPRSMDVRIKMCYKDFEGAFVQWGLANGYDRRNLAEAEFFDFIESLTAGAMARDFVRVANHGNKDIAVDAILGPNAVGEVDDYNQIDAGLKKSLQLLRANPEFADQFISIGKNAGADAAAQKLADGEALSIYDQLNENIEFEGGDTFYTSHSLYTNYKNLFRGKLLESGVAAIQNSFEPNFDNKPLLDMRWSYDQIIKRDFTDAAGAKDVPHLALIADKSNLQIGVDDTAALTDLRLEYVGGKDENFYIKASYLMDFKIANPYAVAAAF
ncbi:hypothetical protein [uncultured Christiangramia sp.]|uniref:hypothetical protein n=1 Tax=uncultured Christiangramia sp. TaxID=503836 RepID=UPI00262618BA|nr:hypothetical protein [uncultured Christiangramia sp.]